MAENTQPWAMLSRTPGGPDTLERAEINLPPPGKGELRVAVRAAGVNFPDTLIIEDRYQFKPERPFAPGGEVAGVVEAVGDGVEGFAEGDRVLALPIWGGFASHMNLRAKQAVKIPDAMPFDEAAALILTYGTSYYGLVDRGALAAGQDVFILGAAGGVGASAIEIARAKGARVIAGVSSEDKAAFARELGADEVVIYPRDMDRDAQKALSAELKALAPKGLDIVYDPVGGDYAEPALRAIAWEGRFLVVGFPAGIPALPFNLMLLKNCQVVGVFWGAFTERDPARFAEHLADLFAMYGRGEIRPRVSERLPLQRAAEALHRIAARKAKGKIVLTVD